MTDFKPGDRVEFYNNGKESIHHNKVYTVKEVIDKDTVTFEEEVPGFGGLWATWAFRLVAEAPEDTGYTVEVGGQSFTQAQWEAVQVYAKGTMKDVKTVAEEEPKPRYLSDEELRFNIFVQRPIVEIERLEDVYQWVRNGWAKYDEEFPPPETNVSEEPFSEHTMTSEHELFYNKGVADGRRAMNRPWFESGRKAGFREGVYALSNKLRKHEAFKYDKEMIDLIYELATDVAWPEDEAF